MDNSQLKEYEESANRFSIKCQCMTMIFPFITWILNHAGVFIVESKLMAASLWSSLAVTIFTIVICKILGAGNRATKYFAMLGIVVAICVQSCALTYHMYMLMVLPVIYSVQYGQRKMVYYTYILSVISIAVSVYVGYYFGLCDANMAVLTAGSLSTYVDATGKIFNAVNVNSNPAYTLFMYFVVPRSMMMLAVLLMVIHISDIIQSRAVREEKLKQMSEIDEMTGLYNKNKYLEMMKSYYPDIENVAVIFWDVNGLKATNDTYGHRAGDRLIKNVAISIEESVNDSGNIFRIGGDEFIAVLENVIEEDVKIVVNHWKKCMVSRNVNSELELSASVGYSMGNGRDIERIVDDADSRMYEQKQRYKKTREDI